MNAFTFGDQAFLARAGTDFNTLYPLAIPNLIKWHRADSMLPFAADGTNIGGATSVNNRPPWRDESGYDVGDSGATTGSTGGGVSNVIDIVGGSFTFAASDVGKTIRWTSGVAIDTWITNYASPTQVLVNKFQVVAPDTFKLTHDARHATTGALFKENIVGTMPVVRFSTAFGTDHLYFSGQRLTLTDFTLVQASMGNDTATSGCFLLSDVTLNHHLRRRYKTTVNPDIFLFSGPSGLSIRTNPDDPPGSVFDFHVATFRRTASSGVVQFRLNQTNLVTQGGTDTGDFRADLLGSYISDWRNRTDVGEFLLWARVLSDTELSNLYTNYLKPRWTTLP
jgi:hypothetical protein